MSWHNEHLVIVWVDGWIEGWMDEQMYRMTVKRAQSNLCGVVEGGSSCLPQSWGPIRHFLGSFTGMAVGRTGLQGRWISVRLWSQTDLYLRLSSNPCSLCVLVLCEPLWASVSLSTIWGYLSTSRSCLSCAWLMWTRVSRLSTLIPNFLICKMEQILTTITRQGRLSKNNTKQMGTRMLCHLWDNTDGSTAPASTSESAKPGKGKRIPQTNLQTHLEAQSTFHQVPRSHCFWPSSFQQGHGCAPQTTVRMWREKVFKDHNREVWAPCVVFAAACRKSTALWVLQH